MMAVDKATYDLICGQLAQILPVRTRTMFGGVGLFDGDSIFGFITDDTLYFKIDDQTRPMFEAAGMHPFAPPGNGRAVMPYYTVPLEALEDIAEFRPWVERALEVAHRAAAKKSGKRKG